MTSCAVGFFAAVCCVSKLLCLPLSCCTFSSSLIVVQQLKYLHHQYKVYWFYKMLCFRDVLVLFRFQIVWRCYFFNNYSVFSNVLPKVQFFLQLICPLCQIIFYEELNTCYFSNYSCLLSAIVVRLCFCILNFFALKYFINWFLFLQCFHLTIIVFIDCFNRF